ncbi:MAG: LuxR C-terminal-related transcriptional regulator [Egibacteraceae bacterium]
MAALERREELDEALLTALSVLIAADSAVHATIDVSDPRIAGADAGAERSSVVAAGTRTLAAVTIHERLAHVFTLRRDERDFAQVDRQRLTVLQPHLRATCERVERAARTRSRRGANPAIDSLSARELQVLVSIVDGQTNRQIARRLRVSSRTVDKHVEHILHKLGVGSRTAAAAQYLRGALGRKGERLVER